LALIYGSSRITLSRILVRFSHSTILVTGALGGLGRAIAHAFADEGGQVIITDVNKTGEKSGGARGLELANHIGRGAEFMILDVSNESSWQRVLDSLDVRFGGLDVLVNNAGFFQSNIPFEEMPLSVWKKHFTINSDGVFLGCKHGIRRMKQRGGAIVNIGSGLSIKAQATSSAYCASKAAVLMTTRTAANAGGRYNIRVNAVLPGPVNTEMLMGNRIPVERQTENEFIEQLAGHSPLGRLATAKDVAHAVLFLADPGNSIITGTYLPVDGGNLVFRD
jgi:NAD(P)-dependent dehydrogenase (short-subunit alcohol dehydrogenase family)